MKAEGYSETLVDSYHTTRRHIAEDSIIFTYLRENVWFTKINLASLWVLLICGSEDCDVVVTYLLERCILYRVIDVRRSSVG